MLNIEAYPNPTPVILEITAQAPGLSAEEMERYYTLPMEIGLYSTPGIDVIRLTSFYGLSFVRVTFKYGVDYYFAFSQAAIAMQQNVNLPGGLVPTIQRTVPRAKFSVIKWSVRRISRSRICVPCRIRIVTRRLLTIPGIAAVNSWGGPTKEFLVEVNSHKLEAYNVTVPQILTALGNANVNVGGREITIGQQSINIRGVGLIDDAANDNLVNSFRVGDIENVVLGQSNSVPVLVKDVAKVSVSYRPRLGILGRDNQDDVVGAIVVQRRTEKTAEMIPKVEAAIETLNHDGSLPPGVKVVPFYDRSSLIDLTTHTVLHNLIFGIILVFLIQWIFLGNLRSATIVAINIPFALFFATILLVITGESANLLSVGAVDFGIIVDSAVILVENIFRNSQHPLSDEQGLLVQLASGYWGADPTRDVDVSAEPRDWTDRLRLILISGIQIDRAVLFSALITVAAFVPLFTMQGVEGQIFGPMARTLRICARWRATRDRYPGRRVHAPASQSRGKGHDHRSLAAQDLQSSATFRAASSRAHCRTGTPSFLRSWDCSVPTSEVNSFPILRKATSGFVRRCRSRSRSRTARQLREKCARFCCVIQKLSR